MAQQHLVQSDAAIDAFDRLHVQEVDAEYYHTASTFLASFQSAAASLEPDERIKLGVYMHENGVELLKAVLADPQASKICALLWNHSAENDVTCIIPLLINNCPELFLLWVDFEHHSAFDFVSSVLEHPNIKIKELHTPRYTRGDLPRFFAALGQSQVSAITVVSLGTRGLWQGLCEYLAKDLLVLLRVWMSYEQVPPEMMMSLANCTRLAEFNLAECKLFQPTVFANLPKSVTKLVLCKCRFIGGFDWSFLTGSGVRELDLSFLEGVDGNHLGDALAVHLRAKGLDELCFDYCDFANETLATVGVEIGRIQRLDLEDTNLNDASVELISHVLQSPNSEMKELSLLYARNTMSSIENHLMPALKHPNCNLAKLSFWARQEHEAAAETVETMFRNRLALLVLLQGQQVRRKVPCLLRRLPVEMFRLVGMALL